MMVQAGITSPSAFNTTGQPGLDRKERLWFNFLIFISISRLPEFEGATYAIALKSISIWNPRPRPIHSVLTF